MRYGYERIVVGVDFSRTSLEAVRRGLDLGRRLDAQVHLVHVDPKLRPTFPFSSVNRRAVAKLQREQRRESRERIHALAPKEGPLDVRTAVVTGVPSDALLRYCERHQADLLVLGSLGRSQLAELLVGSTAEHCVARGQLPVLLVPRVRTGA